MSDPVSTGTNNPTHVAFCVAIVAAASALLLVGKLSGAEWVSAVTWMAGILILGQPVGVVATGFSVAAQAKAAQTVQSLKDNAK